MTYWHPNSLHVRRPASFWSSDNHSSTVLLRQTILFDTNWSPCLVIDCWLLSNRWPAYRRSPVGQPLIKSKPISLTAVSQSLISVQDRIAINHNRAINHFVEPTSRMIVVAQQAKIFKCTNCCAKSVNCDGDVYPTHPTDRPTKRYWMHQDRPARVQLKSKSIGSIERHRSGYIQMAAGFLNVFRIFRTRERTTTLPWIVCSVDRTIYSCTRFAERPKIQVRRMAIHRLRLSLLEVLSARQSEVVAADGRPFADHDLSWYVQSSPKVLFAFSDHLNAFLACKRSRRSLTRTALQRVH